MPAIKANTALLLVLLVCSLQSVLTQVSPDSDPQCTGVFNFFFVLDASQSVGKQKFGADVIPFVKNVTEQLNNPEVRYCFITFSDIPELHLELTSDRNKIAEGLKSLENAEFQGKTLLEPGFQQVNDQLDKYGSDIFSIILSMTDGKIMDADEALQQADAIRQKGGSLFAIGVSNVDEEQLANFADEKEDVFVGKDFSFLDTIVDSVVEETCIEITSANPLSVCQQESDNTNITLTGKGLNHTLTPEKIACLFVYSDQQFETSKPVGPTRSDRLVCQLPTFNVTGPVLIQVTLNGVSYITSNVTVMVEECQSPNAALGVGLFFGLLALLILIALLVLWFFFPVIVGKVVKVPDEPYKDSPKSPRKWDVVDTSYYGGGGVGGIKPVTVRWGDKGATEEGSKLTPAKDATILEIKEEPGKPGTPEPRTSCWTAFKKKVFRGYAFVASYRPVRGQETLIVWFPQSHSTPQKYKKANTTAKLSVYMEEADGPNKASVGKCPKTNSISRPPPPRPPAEKKSLPRGASVSRPPPPKPPRAKAMSLSRTAPPHPPPPSEKWAQTMTTSRPQPLPRKPRANKSASVKMGAPSTEQ